MPTSGTLTGHDIRGLHAASTTLANGARIMAIHAPQAKTSTVVLSLRAGMRDERRPAHNGIMRLIEHIISQDSQPVQGLIRPRATAQAGSVLGGHTHMDYTEFCETGSTQHLGTVAERLVDQVFSPVFCAEQLTGHIDALAMKRRQQLAAAPGKVLPWPHLTGAYWHDHPNGHDGSGDADLIDRVTPELLASIHRQLYQPAGAVLVALSPLPIPDAIQQLTEAFGCIAPGDATATAQPVGLPLSQHLGAPATACVAVGDTVKVGQKIGEQAGFISAPVHSSVSGTVIAIEDRPHASRGTCLSVVIKNDGLNTVHESVKPNKPLEELSVEEIVSIVKEAGIVGMGGAGFPTYVKLQPGKPIEAVLINACECEPMLTADHRVLLEQADDVIYGLKAVMKAVAAPKGIIVIEDNKPDAIELMQAKVADEEGLEVLVAHTKYPQGGEKMLIKYALGRSVPSGKLPADVGACVSNVSTVKAIADAIKLGMPLIERVTTVTGKYIPNPGNFLVKIGTSAEDLVNYCGGITTDDCVIKAGGPMMGFPQKDVIFPIMKGSNGIITVDTDNAEPNECIKCGRCVDVCPMELKPLYFYQYAKEENWEGFKAQNVMDCMECRCCEYICSSKLPLVSMIKTGKNAVRGMK